MTYLDRINCFWQFANVEPLSAGQKLLYLALLDINNSCRWAEWFTAANSILQFKTGLSRKAIEDARNRLMQVGLISYKKGRGNRAGSYCILEFECNILPTNYPQTARKLYTKRGTSHAQGATLIDKDKEKDKDNLVVGRGKEKNSKVYQFYEENIGGLTDMITEELDECVRLLFPEAVIYAMRQAALNNKKSCGYIKGVCRKLIREGVKTTGDLERRIREREEREAAPFKKDVGRKEYIHGDRTYTDKDLFDIFE